MKIAKLLLLLTFLITGQTFAKDAQYLIQEMEQLRDSLEFDDPARIDLTLRLADLYFDVSIKEGGEGDFKLLKEKRRKALELYETSLNGTNGVKKAEGLTRLKVEFQMARLLTRLEEFKRAEKHYLNVQAHKEVPKKMKEQASLALAEWYEEEARYPEAKKYYDQAISLCDVRSSCNYAHYRKGWLYFKDTKLEDAIKEMKASLWATDTEIRESSLQDLILFMSNANTQGEEELKYIKGLAQKLNRPELVQSLVEAFYVAGNRRAGSHLLSYINKQTPSLYFETRLLEEFYGFRNWEKVDQLLKDLQKRTSADIPQKKEHAKEVQKIFRRYLVQVDSEATVVPELNSYLKASIDVYLGIYPNDDLRKKLQQGWLKAEDDQKAKITRLGKWIKEDIQFGFDDKEVRKLRQTRLSLAQKEKNSEVVLEESLAIAAMLKGKPEADEFNYVAAREYYGRKDFDKALPLFKDLVTNGLEQGLKTKWALLSQNLILDIYNSRDNFEGITAQVALWTAATKDTDNKAIQKENQEMSKLSIDARFALAAKREDSPESLQEFYDFCFQGIYPEKSCKNAKILSVKFKDQAKLISLLEKANDEAALMNEYELMGRYSDAAKLQEKLNLKKQGAKAPHELYLKIALLYELDQNFGERDRVLKSLISKVKREKNIPEQLEGAIFLTLDEAGMISPASLSLPWSLKRKISLANRFEFENPSKTNQKIILGQKESQGPLWSRLVLAKFVEPFKTANSIKFYGRYSQYLFKKRTKAIDKFVDLSKKYLEGSDLETRSYILHMLTRTYSKMVEDILSTPLPEGLDAETMAQVQMQLQGLSAPFDKVREDYQRLLDKQLADMVKKEGETVDTSFKDRVVANLEKNPANYVELVPLVEPNKNELIQVSEFGGATEIQKILLGSPTNKEALNKLQSYFEDKNRLRLSAYYKGRLEALTETQIQSEPVKKEKQ